MDTTMHVMFDIETTGITPGCNVLSIGATTFRHDPITFYEKIKWDPLHPDFSNEKVTMNWWTHQNQEAVQEAFSGTAYYVDVLQNFSNYIRSVRKTHRNFLIYANGAAFDFPIIEYAYNAVGIAVPWQYHERQCYSTLRKHFPRILKPAFTGVKHNALDDAVYQAAHCEKILQFIS